MLKSVEFEQFPPFVSDVDMRKALLEEEDSSLFMYFRPDKVYKGTVVNRTELTP